MCYPTFSSWGSGGAVSPPPAGLGAEPRRQTHFGTNVLKINSKSGPFSVAVYTPNSDPISDVHWLLQRKIGSVVRGCEKNLLISGWRPDVRHRGGATSSALANLDHSLTLVHHASMGVDRGGRDGGRVPTLFLQACVDYAA